MKLKEYINGKFQASVIVVVIGIGNVSLNCVLFFIFFGLALIYARLASMYPWPETRNTRRLDDLKLMTLRL